MGGVVCFRSCLRAIYCVACCRPRRHGEFQEASSFYERTVMSATHWRVAGFSRSRVNAATAMTAARIAEPTDAWYTHTEAYAGRLN